MEAVITFVGFLLAGAMFVAILAYATAGRYQTLPGDPHPEVASVERVGAHGQVIIAFDDGSRYRGSPATAWFTYPDARLVDDVLADYLTEVYRRWEWGTL